MIFTLFVFSSCSDTENLNSCDPVVFDQSKFNEEGHYGINLIDYSLIDNCLKVTLGISGCSADHRIEMISDGAEAPSFPTVIFCDFYDYDPELCEAYFTVEREYDVSPIQDKFGKTIIVQFRDNEGSFTID